MFACGKAEETFLFYCKQSLFFLSLSTLTECRDGGQEVGENGKDLTGYAPKDKVFNTPKRQNNPQLAPFLPWFSLFFGVRRDDGAHKFFLWSFSTFYPQKNVRVFNGKEGGEREKKRCGIRIILISTASTAPNTSTPKSFFHSFIHSVFESGENGEEKGWICHDFADGRAPSFARALCRFGCHFLARPKKWRKKGAKGLNALWKPAMRHAKTQFSLIVTQKQTPSTLAFAS